MICKCVITVMLNTSVVFFDLHVKPQCYHKLVPHILHSVILPHPLYYIFTNNSYTSYMYSENMSLHIFNDFPIFKSIKLPVHVTG